MRVSQIIFTVFLLTSTGLGFTQDKFYVHVGPPPGGASQLERYTVVSLDGLVAFNAFDFYQRARTEVEGGDTRLPSSYVDMKFSLNFDYHAPSGDEFPHDIIWPEAGLGIYNGKLQKGYYRNTRWNFLWPGRENAGDSWTVYSGASLVIPSLIKVPVYMYMDSLNKDIFARENRLVDMAEFRKLFRGLEKDVSRLAINGNKTYKDNFGCPAWYQFRFYGYVQGFAGGLDSPDDINRLPPGITIVPRIQYCSRFQPEGVAGCATASGNKIAISADILARPEIALAIVALHEIGHTMGLEHDNSKPDQVMNELTNDSSVGIQKRDCPAFSATKKYVTPDPFEIKEYPNSAPSGI